MLPALLKFAPILLNLIKGKPADVAGGVLIREGTKGLMRSKMVWYIAASTAVKTAISELPVGDDTKAWIQFGFVLVDFAAIVYLRAITKEPV